jgi:hypothetical protein
MPGLNFHHCRPSVASDQFYTDAYALMGASFRAVGKVMAQTLSWQPPMEKTNEEA